VRDKNVCDKNVALIYKKQPMMNTFDQFFFDQFHYFFSCVGPKKKKKKKKKKIGGKK